MNIILKAFLNPLTKGVTFFSANGASVFSTSPQGMSDEVATMLGRKHYQHGTTYKNGIAPTITLFSGGGTLSSIEFSQFIPYQTQDGNWRMRFNLKANVSSTSRSNARFAVVGVTFPATGDAISGGVETSSATTYFAFTESSSNIGTDHSSTTASGYRFSGDVRLASKPTWAY